MTGSTSSTNSGGNLSGNHHCIGSNSIGGATLFGGGGMHERGGPHGPPTSMTGLGGQNAGLFTFAVAPHPRA
uniref:Uncharacterized protein n=1 Tax=Anopheles dirus TaxID=7168 RepID=A0A182NRW0_9DIPT